MEKNKRSSFGGTLGFILVAAGSAVGLGNIWRFPYLAAKDGGGMFLFVYLILAVTFGFTLLTSEIAIGRKTRQSPLTAYSKIKSGKVWKGLGIVACLVPFIIMPYYCVIGGWVTKYFVAYLTGDSVNASTDGYFTSFITGQYEPIIYTIIFLALVAFIIFRGVNKGIESSSKIIMPMLVILVLLISIFALTIKHTDAEGVTRTGLDGLKVYVIPDFASMTFEKFFGILLDAMGQLFYSISVAMGIMVAYGSYVKDEDNIIKSINHIELFDTAIAFLAGVMIIPAVFAFMGHEGLESSGPSLMFISLPKVFDEMGVFGRVTGILFFAMVLFAALTSAVSIMEAIVSSFMDEFHITRKKATVLETIFAVLLAIIVCLGYNILYFEIKLPNGATAQILDIMDYVSNNIFMPVVAIGTCILIGWVTSPNVVIDEAEKSGHKFGRRSLYILMIKYISPILLGLLLLKSIGLFG